MDRRSPATRTKRALPAAAASTATSAAGAAAPAEAAAAATAGRGRHHVRHAGRELAHAPREAHWHERPDARVPVRLGALRREPLERLGPLVHALEDDGVGEVIVEDVPLLCEALAFLLR